MAWPNAGEASDSEQTALPAAAEEAHIPVLLDETLTALALHPGGKYVDATVGMGGHGAGILARTSPDGQLLGIDRDPQAIALARQRLGVFGGRVQLVCAAHSELGTVARAHGFTNVQGVLLDLGVSSLQLGDGRRGFSFRQDGPLDMRFGPQGTLTAAEIVNTWSEQDLSRIFFEYGEERRSRYVAQAICRRRPLKSTLELADIVRRVVGYSGRIDPATRTFQALRIAVNDELQSLENVLPQIVPLLAPAGRLVVIAFHSIEDRIVKRFMAREASDCVCPPGLPVCQCGHSATLIRIAKKPLRASGEETLRNPRSRSARLRVAERV